MLIGTEAPKVGNTKYQKVDGHVHLSVPPPVALMQGVQAYVAGNSSYSLQFIKMIMIRVTSFVPELPVHINRAQFVFGNGNTVCVCRCAKFPINRLTFMEMAHVKSKFDHESKRHITPVTSRRPGSAAA